MIAEGTLGAYDLERADSAPPKAEAPGPGQARWCPAISFQPIVLRNLNFSATLAILECLLAILLFKMTLSYCDFWCSKRANMFYTENTGFG